MRFNIFLCLSFLAILTSVSARPTRRDLSEVSELNSRNDDALEPSSDILLRRAKLPQQIAADARTAARKQAGQATYGAAAAAQKATTNLPGRKQQFTVPNNGPTFSGKEVRKAVFDSHMARIANTSPPTRFGNFNHRLPNPNRPGDTRPINNMRGPGHEYPLGSTAQGSKGPARIITQPTPGGGTKFQGVVSHDVTRARGTLGYNDHFQVKRTGGKPTPLQGVAGTFIA